MVARLDMAPSPSGNVAKLVLQTPPPLDNTLGALLIGTFCASALGGLSIHQTYRYFRIYGSDPRLLKAMVMALCVLDAAHEIMAIHISYFYLITNYFNPIRLLTGVWSLRLIVTVTGLTATITHLFFARRVFILSGGQRFYPFCAVILIVAELGFCIVATVAIFLDVTFARFQEHSSWIIYTALGLRVATDLVLTLSLIFLLQKSRTGFKSTDTMIDVLIIYAINTGLVTSLVSLAAVITAFVLPNTLIYIAIYIVSSKMYSSSVISVLNTRKGLSRLGSGRRTSPTDWLEICGSIPASSQKTQPTEHLPGDGVDVHIKPHDAVNASSSTVEVDRQE